MEGEPVVSRSLETAVVGGGGGGCLYYSCLRLHLLLTDKKFVASLQGLAKANNNKVDRNKGKHS